MIPLKKFGMVSLGMFVLQGILLAAEGPQEESRPNLLKELDKLRPLLEEKVVFPPILENAVQNYLDVVSAAISVVKTIPADARYMTVNQKRAVNILGHYRAIEGCDELLRILTVPSPPTGPLYASSHHPDPKEEIDRYPAAKALSRIGTPAVQEIFERLSTDPQQPEELRMRLYAEIVWRALGRKSSAKAYLKSYIDLYYPEGKPNRAQFLQLLEEMENPSRTKK